MFLSSHRGAIYERKGDFDQAIANFTQAIRINPNYVLAYVNRGIAYYRKSDYTHARADWNRALQLDPNNATARSNLGALWDIKGR
jgi:Flp pilus assembly protein TadD